MNKKALTENDIRSKFLTPALVGANGDKGNLHTQIREEVSHRGRVVVRGRTVRRGEILADQTKTNDFKPFGAAMIKIANRTIDKSPAIYLCLYRR